MRTRLGVVGTGGIAASLTADLALLPNVDMVAVGSRNGSSARAFAAAHGISRAHSSYESLVSDPEVDVVYIATPHPGHHGAAMQAIEAGKAVLVEKPFTMDSREAASLVAAARARGVFCMEAMWMRFNPHIAAVREVLARGEIGEITTVLADHGQWFPFDPAHRLFAPSLGGGALLDLGIYPVSLASMLLGAPSEVSARATFTSTGVDAQTSVLLSYRSGAQAVLTSTLRARTGCRATIVGTEGRIEIDPTWYAPSRFTVVPRVGEPWRHEARHEGNGLRHEVAEVARCLAAGLTESPIMPLDETVSIMATLDEVRAQIGLRYPVTI